MKFQHGDALRVGALYLILTLVWSWPLVLHLPDAVAPDLGEPLLNSWILAWNFRQFEGGPRVVLGRQHLLSVARHVGIQ